jgi:nucleoside-diphosphate-sugar epimerase
MRVFVAGATGVIGSRAVPLLIAGGHDVTGVARSAAKAATLTAQGATPALVDIFDVDALASLVAGHEVVINLATHVPTMTRAVIPGASREHDKIRTLGATNLAAAARAAKATRYVQESVTFTYSDAADGWIDESAPRDVPAALRSSETAERQATSFTDSGGCGIVLRFAQLHSADGHITRDLVRFARHGVFAWPGAPDAYLSALHADDAATAVVAALDAPAGTYNVADDEPLTRSEHASALAGALGRSRVRTAPRLLTTFGGSAAEALARSQRIRSRTFATATGWAPAHATMRESWPRIVAELQGRG